MAELSRRLLQAERERMIMARLAAGARGIAELSAEIGVSEATIRRDLGSLERAGRIRRVHGGAVGADFPLTEPVFEEKEHLRSTQKKDIAEAALALVDNGDTIYLDGGSTVLALARLLRQKRNLTIVTNSLTAAAELMESGHRLILVGGECRPLSRTLVGPLTAHVINALRFDKAFIGTMGFTVEDGITTTDPNEAFTKELVMKKAKKVFLLADSSKIGSASFAVSGAVTDIDALLTDDDVSSDVMRQLTKLKVKVIK